MTQRRPSLPAARACCGPLTATALAALYMAICTTPADAQLLQRPLAIQNARIVTMDGAVIESGTLLIKGKTIAALGPDVKPSILARRIDARGRTITPGLIDAFSVLGSSSAGGGSAGRRAEDAFDRYDMANLVEALRNGVTAVYLSPGRSAGMCGTGAILRLAHHPSGAGIGRVLKSEAALGVNLGSTSRPIARLKTFAAVRKQFRDALDYRQSMEDYKEDVAEYEKKLKEWIAKQEEEKSKDKKKDGKGNEKNNEPTEEKEAARSPAAATEEMPIHSGVANVPRAPNGSPALATENIEPRVIGHAAVSKSLSENQASDPGAPSVRVASTGQKEPAKKEEPKKEEDGKPKKPQRPGRKPHVEVVLKALDRELPVRIVAHRSEDILNALELAEEFSLDLILEGGTEAHLVSQELARAKVLVVLGNLARSSVPKDDVFRRAATDTAAVLTAAGVPWVVSSGAESSVGTRFVALNSQLSAARGGQNDPLVTVTSAAADALRVADKIGRLRPGLLADFVLWSGDPLDPSSRVQQVYVGGVPVYEASDKPEQGRTE